MRKVLRIVSILALYLFLTNSNQFQIMETSAAFAKPEKASATTAKQKPAQQPLKILIDDLEFKSSRPVFNQNGTTYVALRDISGYYRLKIGFGSGNTVRVDSINSTLLLTSGSRLCVKFDIQPDKFTDGFTAREIKLSTPVSIINGSAYVPLKSFSQALDYVVKFDSVNKQILITTNPNIEAHLREIFVSTLKSRPEEELKNSSFESLQDEFVAFIEKYYTDRIYSCSDWLADSKIVQGMKGWSVWTSRKLQISEYNTGKIIDVPKLSKIVIQDEEDKDNFRGLYDKKYYKVPISFLKIKHYYSYNPYYRYGWGNKAWDAIKQDRVYPGMNKMMVSMSLGDPKKIDKRVGPGKYEVWHYENIQVYFKSGRLFAFRHQSYE